MDPTLALELYGRLVALETTSAGSNLAAVAALEAALDLPGATLRRIPSPDGDKANLFVRVGPEVDPRTRAGLLLCGHTDCVPAREPEWTVDPFALTDRGDRWLGRGTADMKGFVALAATLAATVEPTRLRAPLCLLFTYDEEVGMLGAREVVRQWPAGETLPRACVIGEPTSLAVVRLHKGHLKLRVTLSGRAAHSGTPHHGDNAIEKAAPVVAALAALRRELETEGPQMADVFPEAPFVPLNVATIAGGVAINVVPDRCVVELGFRPLPGSDVDALRARVEAAVRAAAPDAAIELAGYSEPLSTAEAAPIHRRLCELVGQRASRGAPFATDGGPLAALDLDTVVWGPGSIEVAHRADEWMPKA
ncbi:MAG: acetylornithine deacetylase, partial [Thermoanaerobaculia bacterium]|nr:acetylornithine deacetylase [Thermoanaerobaculia bacterium]